MAGEEHFGTVVVGGGQAGLATAYHLKQTGDDFVVLESQPRLGESWRERWNSLRLFTPSKFNGLPSAPFPGEDFYFPTKNEVADYVEGYARARSLPVRTGCLIDSLTRTNGTYRLTSGSRSFAARNVVIATGAYRHPSTPPFASALSHAIVQLHSSEYRQPGQLPEGSILVVGAGNSGAEIAIELARSGRTVWLSGREVGRIPADKIGRIFGGRPYWFFLSKVLSVTTPVGRKVRAKALRQGSPLIRLNPEEITKAGVKRCPRVKDVTRGLPLLEDGRMLEVSGVVWATGFRPDYRWIKLPAFTADGFPDHERGVVSRSPGLYFVGLHFQTALASALLGGVGNDARHIVHHLRSRAKGTKGMH